MSKKQTAEGEASEPKKKKPAGGAKKPAAKKPAAKKPAAKKPARKKKGDESTEADTVSAALEDTAAAVADQLDDDIEDAEVIAETPLEAMAVDEPPVALTEEEQQLAAIYGDDLSAPAKVHGEYQDRQTADEDRPMMPEINARDERKAHWQDRRQQRRQRREQRDQERLQRRDQQRANQTAQGPGGGERQPDRQPDRDRPPGDRHERQGQLPLQARSATPPPPAAATNGHDHDALARVGTPLGDAAATVFAQLRNGQPLPVRQLAAMMRKRSLVESDPEQLAPQLKAELLGDERSYRTLGLRPRIVYRGRDLFAPGPVAMSVTADAEAGFAAALSRLAGATHRALAHRISKASPAGFERLIHAYLVAAGYRDIAWVKRIGGISYASATAPGIDRTVLISARSGDSAIDRRGIGELRVGVEAKNLVAGILFCARELSEDAEKELERAGRSIAVVCGDQLVAALIANGVGVVSSAAPLHYVDDQLLDELLAG
ncbi:MAG TPA: restriction endonuclease [Kofleriaceae bacterium]